MPEHEEELRELEDADGDLDDEEPIPARRDTGIFRRKKDGDEQKDDFDEDVFV